MPPIRLAVRSLGFRPPFLQHFKYLNTISLVLTALERPGPTNKPNLIHHFYEFNPGTPNQDSCIRLNTALRDDHGCSGTHEWQGQTSIRTLIASYEAILGETSKDRQLGKKKVNEMSYFIVTIDSASITPDLHCASCVRRTSRVVHLFKFKLLFGRR